MRAGEEPRVSGPAAVDSRRRVLLIGDDGAIAEAMAYPLEQAGLCVKIAKTGEEDVETRSIDAHIRRPRLKLGPARTHIETSVGLGSRFVR